MKKLLSLLLFLPLFSNAQGIKFEEGLNWEQVKQKAKAEKKYIFVDAYATWCGPCKLMDKNVYPNDTIGEFLNDKFISVKVQMDETDKDNPQIKAWYADSRRLKEQYKIEGYPSYLFLSSEGELTHQAVGAKTVPDFLDMVKHSLTNPLIRYENYLVQFNKGNLDFKHFPELARQAKKNRQAELVKKIVVEYKKDFLDKLDIETAFTKDNLLFVAEFAYYFLNSKDRFFQFFYIQGSKADSIMNRMIAGRIDNVSKKVTTLIIQKEEIIDKIYRDGKPIVGKPDWNELINSVYTQYGSAYREMFFPDEQINYYQRTGNWKNYILYVNEKIKSYPPVVDGKKFGKAFGDSWQLNSYAWALFKGCANKKFLKKGITWIDMAVRLEKKELSKGIYLDTKANLLYRIGKMRDAINLEEKAISLLSRDLRIEKEYKEVLEKMKKGVPTWVVSGENKD